MPKIKATVRVTLNTLGFEIELLKHLNDKSKQIANAIMRDAKTTTAFKDVSGRLRKSIKTKKSKYDDGGYMVKAGGKGAMQAWLIEFGHTKSPNPVPHPFLKPAFDRNIKTAVDKFNERMK